MATQITPAEYLERERSAAFRSEYLSGQMYAMAGASLRHNRVNLNVLASLTSVLIGCEAVSSDQRIYSPKRPFFAYPDTLVYCGEPQLMPDELRDTVLNPSIIVEVLSDSTRAYDLGLKFEMYQDVPSLQDYLAIEPDFVCVHHFLRHEFGHWDHAELRSLENAIRFFSPDGEISLASIYKGIAI